MKPVTVYEAITSNFKHRKAIQIPTKPEMTFVVTLKRMHNSRNNNNKRIKIKTSNKKLESHINSTKHSLGGRNDFKPTTQLKAF